MRFMIIVKATRDSEAGVMPEESLMAAMAAYHEELVKAGVLLDASGLQPSVKGTRIKYWEESVLSSMGLLQKPRSSLPGTRSFK